MLENSYFNWEGTPAVAHQIDSNTDLVSFMRDGDKDWRKGDGPLLAELFINAERLSKPEFEEYFGVIGEVLPELPKT